MTSGTGFHIELAPVHVWLNQQLNDFTMGVRAKSHINKAEMGCHLEISPLNGLNGFCPLSFP